MMKLIKTGFLALVLTGLLVVIQSCTGPKDYDSVVKRELATGERNDTLFFGIYFDMTAKDFYEQCWEYNKRGLFRDGTGNQFVRYDLKELDHEGAFEFYPIFDNGRINSMTAFVAYDAWAPWNKHLFAANLIEDIKEILSDWYDTEFYPMKSPSKYGKAYFSVQGNREIMMYYQNDDRVEILFTDLTKQKT